MSAAWSAANTKRMAPGMKFRDGQKLWHPGAMRRRQTHHELLQVALGSGALNWCALDDKGASSGNHLNVYVPSCLRAVRRGRVDSVAVEEA